MKSFLLISLFVLPLSLFAQKPGALIIQEINDLIDFNRTLLNNQTYDKALQVIKKANRKVASTFGDSSLLYATCQYNLGRTLVMMEEYKEAEKPYLTAMALRGKLSGERSLDYAISANSLAMLYRIMERYPESEGLFLKGIEIKVAILGEYDISNTINFQSLANLYLETGELSKSEHFFLKAKTIYENLPNNESQGYGLLLIDLGSLYNLTGKYKEAEAALLKGGGIISKVLGKENFNYGLAMFKLGNLYFDLDKYNDAEQLFLQTLELWGSILGKKNPNYGKIINNLGVLYREIGDYAKAERYYLEAKNIWAKTVGKKHSDYAKALNNLGILYEEMGDYKLAEKNYLEAKGILEAIEGENQLTYADILNNLALVYLGMKNYTKAERHFLDSRDTRLNFLGNEHSAYLSSLNNLGILYREMGDFEKAESFYQDAKNTRERVLGKENLDYEFSLHNLSVLYQAMHRIPEAQAYLLEANALVRHYIQQSSAYFSENQMLAYEHSFEKDMTELHSFCQKYPSPELRRCAYDNALFLKGFLLENVRHLAQSAFNADSLTRDTFERWRDCRRRLAEEYALPVKNRKGIEEMETEKERYEKVLTIKFRYFSDAFSVPGWQDVCERLQIGEAAVEFIHYPYYADGVSMSVLPDDTMYAALVILPRDTAPHFIPLFEEPQLQALFNRPYSDEEDIIKHLYGNSPNLRQLLWKPLEPLLNDMKTIYYSPTGLLHRINPAALQDESKQTLSEGRQWVRVGSTRELVTGRLANKSFAKISDDTVSPIGNQLSALIFGGITYDMDSLTYTTVNSIEQLDSNEYYLPKDGNFRYIAKEQSNTKVRGNNNPEACWNSLDSTVSEANDVNTILVGKGFRTEVQTAFYASEERFKQLGVRTPSPRILHIATHGFSYPDPRKDPPKNVGNAEPVYKLLDDPMLRSGLVLAGANFYCKNKRPLTNAEDGMLVAYEVRDLNLQNTELAVLSACQTGLGDVVGSEGVYGLQRAFRIAGAKFLIVSLWDVPDKQTQELMRLFYQNWLDKKESLRDALNHAQQTLKETEPNPVMWAGFVLIE